MTSPDRPSPGAVFTLVAASCVLLLSSCDEPGPAPPPAEFALPSVQSSGEDIAWDGYWELTQSEVLTPEPLKRMWLTSALGELRTGWFIENGELARVAWRRVGDEQVEFEHAWRKSWGLWVRSNQFAGPEGQVYVVHESDAVPSRGEQQGRARTRTVFRVLLVPQGEGRVVGYAGVWSWTGENRSEHAIVRLALERRPAPLESGGRR